MAKKWIISLSLIIIILVVWFSRAVLVRTAANTYLSPYGVHVDCLEWDMDRSLNLQIEHVCLQHNTTRVDAYNVHWARADNQLDIEQVILTPLLEMGLVDPAAVNKKTVDQSMQQNQPIDLTLPDYFPSLNIRSLKVKSAQLRQPVQLSIQQTAANQWTVDDDWHAVITLKKGELSAQLSWTLQDVVNLTASFTEIIQPYLQQYRLDLALLTAPITSQLSFDGQQLRSHHQLNMAQTLLLDECPVNISGVGTIGAHFNWLSSNAELDLSQFTLQGRGQQCAWLQQLPEPLAFSALSLRIPSKLSISEQGLKTTNLSLETIDGTGNVTTAPLMNMLLHFNDIEWRWGGDLHSQYSVDGLVADVGKFHSAGLIHYSPQGLQITGEHNRLQLQQWDDSTWSLQQLDVDFDFTLNTDKSVVLKGQVNLAKLVNPVLTLTDIDTQVQLTGQSIEQLTLELTTNVASLEQAASQQSAWQITGLNNQLTLDIADLNQVNAVGNSHIVGVAYQHKSMGGLAAEHSIAFDVAKQTITSQHQIRFDDGFMVNLSSNNQRAQLAIEHQPLTLLADIAKPWLPELTIQSGVVNTNILFNGEAEQGLGSIELDKLSADYAGTVFNEVSYQSTLSFDSAGLQLSPASLQIKQIDAGVIIKNVDGQLQGSKSQFSLSNIEGTIFDGQFTIDQLWLDGREQTAQVNLAQIDTAKILDLQKQSGIAVTGLIKGNLPLHIQHGQFSIKGGKLSNQGAGQLLINDNQAFNLLKEQQPKLDKQLSLLENLTIDSLTSSVNLAADGMLNMDIAMQGTNPLQQEQVNFNYGHQENILVLLKAIRLTDSLTEKIEQSINK